VLSASLNSKGGGASPPKERRGGVTVSQQHPEQFAERKCGVNASKGLFFLLTIGLVYGCFDTVSNMCYTLLHLHLSALPHYIKIYYVYYFSLVLDCNSLRSLVSLKLVLPGLHSFNYC